MNKFEEELYNMIDLNDINREKLNRITNRLIKSSPVVKSNLTWLLISMFILLVSLVLLIMAVAFEIIEKPEFNYFNYVEEIYPTEVIETTIRNEYIIKGDQQMVCVGAPNSRNLTCYKEVIQDG